jgi:hypothetical protein
LNVAEREQIRDRIAGLKEKGERRKMLAHEVPHGNFSFLLSPFSFKN